MKTSLSPFASGNPNVVVDDSHFAGALDELTTASASLTGILLGMQADETDPATFAPGTATSFRAKVGQKRTADFHRRDAEGAVSGAFLSSGGRI